MVLVAATPVIRTSRCRVAGLACALDLTAIRGVERAHQVTRADGSWPHVGDLTTPSGTAPVFSVAGLLGFPESHHDPGTQIALADTAEGHIGFLLDEVSHGAPVSAGELLPMPALVRLPQIPAVVRTRGGLLPWLDPLALLGGRPMAQPTHPAPWHFTPGAGTANQLMLLTIADGHEGGRPWAAAVPGSVVAEVIDSDGLVPIPGSVGFVSGVIDWRGRAVGVVDLAARLGLPAGGGQPRVVMVSLPGLDEPFGLLVRRGVKLARLPAPSLRSNRRFPGQLVSGTGVVEMDGVTVLLPELVRLPGEVVPG